MAHANARQWQRFSYQAAVSLQWHAESAEHRVPGGRSIDLSRGGIRVRTSAAPELGAAVSCELSCAGRATTFAGRVCWRRADSPDAFEVGIEFGELGSEQRDRVRVLLASLENGGQPVKLQLGSLREPLSALASPTERGMRLRAPLRLLGAGAELDFDLADPPMRFAGRVVSSQLHPAASGDRWELEVLVEERVAPRSRRYTIYQGGQSARRDRRVSARRPTLPGVVAIGSGVDASSPLMAARQQSPLMAAEAALPLMAAEEASPLTAAEPTLPRFEAKSRERLRSVTPEDERLPVIPKSHGPKIASRIAFVIALIAIAIQLSQSEAPSKPTSIAKPISHHPIKLEIPATANELPAEARITDIKAATDIKAVTAPSAPLAPAKPEVHSDPTLKVEGDSSELFVPMSGTLGGMHDAMWIDPFALVIDLPEARLLLAQTRYALKSGGIKQLTVGQLHGVTQLRVYLDALLAHYSVEVVTGGMRIRLKRDLRPLP
jgi:hypothetical protein